jgi:fungal STAND N-terminal Goodbye domain
MSSTTASSTTFQSILDAACDSYAKQTGVELAKHPSADKLQNCRSSEDVLQILLERETAFKDYRDKHRKFLDRLRPIVQVVHKISAHFGKVADFVRS